MHAWLHLSFLFKAHLKPKDEVICVAVLPRASNLIYCDYDNFIYNLPCIYLKLDANVCGLIAGVVKILNLTIFIYSKNYKPTSNISITKS